MAGREVVRLNEDTKVLDLEKCPHLERYDEAVKMLIKQAFAGDVIIAPDGYAYKLAVNQTEDNVTYPFISVYPYPSYTLSDQNSFPQYNIGPVVDDFIQVKDKDTMQTRGRSVFMSKNITTLYIDIDYQVDIWALSRSEGLQVVQELLFWLYNQQEVKIKYYGNEFILSLVPPESFTDNSDLPQVESEGKLYRFTLDVKAHAAVYRSRNWFNVLEESIDLDVSDEDIKGGK